MSTSHGDLNAYARTCLHGVLTGRESRQQRDGPSCAGRRRSKAIPDAERSRELLQDCGDAQIIRMIAVGAPCCGVAELPRQAALI